ncbi:transposase [Bartonella koehlerae]|uniref:transposase n=1 Tax=Bartonella koehlerae TaxID=92181 RepID=UPI000A055A59|nr:transposase [Bartonella koehlerae]
MFLHSEATVRIIFQRIRLDLKTECIEFDDESDHVHLLINYQSKVAIFTLVNN